MRMLTKLALGLWACGGQQSTGSATFDGLGPNDVKGTPVAAYAYGGSYNNSVPIAAVTFYSAAKTSCDGPFANDGGEVLDVSDLTVVVPSGGLHVGDIPLVTDAETAPTSTALATLTFVDPQNLIHSSLSGTLTLTTASPTHLAGNITAAMGVSGNANETITVTFDAPACSSMW